MPGLNAGPLQPENKLQKRLEKLCSSAALKLPQGKKGKKQNILLHLNSNKFGIRQIGLFGGNSLNTMEIEYDAQDSEEYALGYNSWRYSTLAGFPYYSINAINRMQGFAHGFTAAGAYAWTSATTLEIKVHFVDWISGMTYIFDFDKNQISICDTYPNSKPVTIPFTRQ